MSCVIGIDGGASKTQGILADLSGRVLAAGQCPGTNYHHAGLQAAVDLLVGLYRELLRRGQRSPDDLHAICLGLAGVGRPSDRRQVFELLSQHFLPNHCTLLTDADIALLGGCLSDIGVLVIAGTGSIVYGRDATGQTARVGGYGHFISDEGSGYALAQAGLRAILRSRDGLEIRSGIRDKILKHLNLQDEDDLVLWAMKSAQDKAKVAVLAGYVLESYAEGDCVASSIIEEAADQLSLGVQRVADQLDLPDHFPVVLSGGLLNHHVSYFDLLKRKIHGLLPGADVQYPTMAPVLGAVLNALVCAEVSIDEKLVATLRETYKS
ncbi:MAG: BadF/BadG/BcrA/BcrD ATPase family protein [bacterium]